MSSQAEGELLVLLHTSFVTNCAQVAVAALVAYECIRTLGQGKNFIWGRRTYALYVFIFNQCIMLGLVIANVVEMLPLTTNASCQAVGIFYDILQLMTFLEWAVISAIRTQAVSKGSRFLPSLVFALDLVPFATTMYQSVLISYVSTNVEQTITLCEPIFRLSDESNNIALVSSRACAMAADMIVVLVTWLYTRGPELMPQVLAFKVHVRLPALLLRNGALYFIALLLISLAQIIMNYVAALSIGTVFLIPMMSVLVSRFLLNIREAADSTYRMRASGFNATLEGTDSSELSFALQEVNTNTTTDSAQLTSDLARTYDHMEGSSTAVGSVV